MQSKCNPAREGESIMDDKLDEVIKRYPVTVKSKRRIRGAVLLDTDKGICMIKTYAAGKNRLLFEENIKKLLIDGGYSDVDYVIPNTDGELLTDDNSGNRWLMKKWYNGEECDIKDIHKVLPVSANMAVLHKIMVMGQKNAEGFDKGQLSACAGRDTKADYGERENSLPAFARLLRAVFQLCLGIFVKIL